MRSRCVVESNRLREDLSNLIYGLILEVVEPVVLDDPVKSLRHSVVELTSHILAVVQDGGYFDIFVLLGEGVLVVAFAADF